MVLSKARGPGAKCWGAPGQGSGGPKDEDSQAGELKLAAGEGFMGLLGCPRGVEKVRVALQTLVVREREAPHCTPQQPKNSSTIFYINSSPVVILGGKDDICVADSGGEGVLFGHLASIFYLNFRILGRWEV